MRIKALSVVAPWGTRIALGEKTREIRSWRPDFVPIERLLIVENSRRLTHSEDIDPDGRAVAIVRVSDVHEWTPEEAEAEAACSTFEPGWLAWTIEHAQAIVHPFRVVAARRIYELEIPDDLLISSGASQITAHEAG